MFRGRQLRRLPVGLAGMAVILTGCAAPTPKVGPDFSKFSRDDWEEWLTPPPKGQPRPKFKCAKTDLRTDPVWWGTTVTYTWRVTNAGQAPLRLRLVP